MRFLVLGGVLLLAGCGGGTTATNYSEPPPMATIVSTPSPTPTPSAAAQDIEQSNMTDEASNAAAE